jgi:hypothetical protein
MGGAGFDARATGIGFAAALATIPLSGWLLWFVLTVVGSNEAGGAIFLALFVGPAVGGFVAGWLGPARILQGALVGLAYGLAFSALAFAASTSSEGPRVALVLIPSALALGGAGGAAALVLHRTRRITE